MLWLLFTWSVFGFAGPPLTFDRVQANVMAETLVRGDVYAAALDAYTTSDPQRGDVVLYYARADNRTIHIDRVVGLPGDKIQMINGVVFINGAAVPRVPDGFHVMKDALGDGVKAQRYRETLPEGLSYDTLKFEENVFDNTALFEVPPGNYFVLGDNRDNSTDSRIPSRGYISRERVIGRVGTILFSVDRDTGEWRGGFLRPVR